MALWLAVVAGCGPAQDPPSLIEKTRLLGARVEVVGAPERATPRPGERATVTWLVAAPAEMPPLEWAFALCPGRGTALDCAGEPYALATGSGAPRVTVDVPAAEALGDAGVLVLFGRVCEQGAPVIDEQSGRPACADGGAGTTASVAMLLDRGRAGSGENANPSLAGSAISLDGGPWAPAAPTSGGCSDELPRVAAGTGGHVLGLRTAAADRERYTALAGDPPVPVERRESLQISQFVTAGKLDRSFSWIEADDPGAEPSVAIDWTAPEPAAVPPEGLTVRFIFVARDMRGGVDWTERAVCVTP